MREMMRVRSFLMLFVVVAGLSIMASQASATFKAYIADDQLVTGSGDTIVTDQGAGDNFPGSALGQINAGALNVAGFTIVTNVSQSKPLIGSAADPRLSLTFTAVSTDNNPHTVYLYASDTDFTGAVDYDLTLNGTQQGTGNTVFATAFGGYTNTNVNSGTLLAQTGAAGASPFALSVSGSINPSVNPYGLTIGVAITRTSAGTTTGELNFIPEPATASSVAAALAGLMLMRRRRGALAVSAC